MKDGKKNLNGVTKQKKMKAKKTAIKTWSKNKKMPLKKHNINVKTQA